MFTTPIILSLLVVLVALVLFVTEKFSVDITALIVLSLLVCFGLVDQEQSLSGFSSPATITVAAMFILSAVLKKTGLVSMIGNKLIRFADRPIMFSSVLTLFAGFLSSFINNTASVAVMLPTVISICKRKNLAASKFLIPLSYSSQFGGVCTLIGTSTNLLISAIAVANGLDPFTMFEFLEMGLIMFAAGFFYFLLFGKFVLPEYKSTDLSQAYDLEKYIVELRVAEDSPLIGKSLFESNLGKEHDISVLEIHRNKQVVWARRGYFIAAGDILLVKMNVELLVDIQQSLKLEPAPDYKFSNSSLKDSDKTIIEALIPPNSNVIGKSLATFNFQKRFNANVIAIRRRASLLNRKLKDIKLQVGDELLLMVPKTEVAWLENNNNIIILKEKSEQHTYGNKLWISLAITVGVILTATLGILPILHSSIIGCTLMILTRCISIEEAYQAIDWKVVMLLGGVLPLGIALEQSGAIKLFVDYVFNLMTGSSPIAFLSGIYLLTAVLTAVISNNAAAVLLTPLAIQTASNLDVSPYPFLMAVCFAASTCFATPVGYQTNTMIYSPGGYKFSDFMRAGIPLNIIFWILGTIFIPVFWPF